MQTTLYCKSRGRQAHFLLDNEEIMKNYGEAGKDLEENSGKGPDHHHVVALGTDPAQKERECFIDNLLVRIHFITEMISRTGLVP